MTAGPDIRQYDDQATNDEFCRVCYETQTNNLDRLVAPCKCEGSIALIHEHCLQVWNQTRVSASRCELCTHPYRWGTAGLVDSRIWLEIDEHLLSQQTPSAELAPTKTFVLYFLILALLTIAVLTWIGVTLHKYWTASTRQSKDTVTSQTATPTAQTLTVASALLLPCLAGWIYLARRLARRWGKPTPATLSSSRSSFSHPPLGLYYTTHPPHATHAPHRHHRRLLRTRNVTDLSFL